MIKFSGGGGGDWTGEVIVISPATQEYSHVAGTSGEGSGSMLDERSRQLAPGSLSKRQGFSVASLAVGGMYPAAAIMRWNARAHPSQM